MTLHIGPRHADPQNEIREARRLLKERVRDDWYWPVLPAHKEADSGRKSARSRRQLSPTAASTTEGDGRSIGGFRFHTPGEQLYFEPVEWRERTYSSAESDTDLASDMKKKFRFEGPDSVAQQLSDRTTAKKLRRQNALHQEMEWNDGLAHWWSRRDAWCCAAAPTPPPSSTPPRPPPPETPTPTSSSNSETETTTTIPSNNPSPRSSTSTTATSLSPPSSTTHLPASPSPSTPLTTVLIPIAPPILPTHPIRIRISPSMYSEIYTKIILQSRTPSVPINLATLMAALIKGWKDDGEWPPKSAVEGDVNHGAGMGMGAAGKKKKTQKKRREKEGKDGEDGKGEKESALKSGVKAFGRALRLGS